jgi:broad specificity phosphatase PhoE
MKYLISSILFIFIATDICLAQMSLEHKASKTTLIFVRHAEKATDTPKDPPLNELGKKRATRLADLLIKEYSVAAIYSTPYQRTLLTSKPLANKLNQVIMIYNLNDPDALLRSILDQYQGETVLIVGHSNTTPMLVNKLLGTKKYEQLHERVYHALFVVDLFSDGAIIDKKMSY